MSSKFNPNAKRHSTESLIKQFGLQENVINVLRLCLASARKCAKEDNREIDLDLPFLCQLWIDQQGLCAVSNVKMETNTGTHKYRNNLKASIDRINSELGYTKNNVRFLCWQNNNGIGAGSDDEYFTMCASVYFHQLKFQIQQLGITKVLADNMRRIWTVSKTTA